MRAPALGQERAAFIVQRDSYLFPQVRTFTQEVVDLAQDAGEIGKEGRRVRFCSHAFSAAMCRPCKAQRVDEKRVQGLDRTLDRLFDIKERLNPSTKQGGPAQKANSLVRRCRCRPFLLRTAPINHRTHRREQATIVERLVEMCREAGSFGSPMIGAARQPGHGDDGRRVARQIT
jgi:hypothetical protein